MDNLSRGDGNTVGIYCLVFRVIYDISYFYIVSKVFSEFKSETAHISFFFKKKKHLTFDKLEIFSLKSLF